ncbi:MAG: hypothetical protein ACXW4P_03925 [Thermoanaerobaculia bacterium]
MPHGTDKADCIALAQSLAAAYEFPLTSEETKRLSPRLIDGTHGLTVTYMVRLQNFLPPLAFVFYPHPDVPWMQMARETLEFEASCWRRWCANELSRREPPRLLVDDSATEEEAHADRALTEQIPPDVWRLDPPPLWRGMNTIRKDGRHLIGVHEVTLEHGDKSLVLVRPYVPWPTAEGRNVEDYAPELERIVRTVIDDHTVRWTRDTVSRRVLVQDGMVVPTRWRDFHQTYWKLGLPPQERMDRIPPVEMPGVPSRWRWFGWFRKNI